MLPSVVCTPETAGGGIEYAWGKLKCEQRKENDGATKLESGVKFIERVRKLCKNQVVLPIADFSSFSDALETTQDFTFHCRAEKILRRLPILTWNVCERSNPNQLIET